MRFLIFNLAVGAAIFYLLAGDPGIAARQAGLPDAAVSTIDDVSRKAKQAVSNIAADTPEPTQPKAPDTPPQKQTEPQERAHVSTDTEKEVKPSSAASKTPDIETAKYVPSRPVHRAPPPKAHPAEGTRKGEIVADNSDLSKRRAEVLGDGKSERKFTVADGAEMMSPRERYRELSKLVDDMELVYFNSLGN